MTVADALEYCLSMTYGCYVSNQYKPLFALNEFGVINNWWLR